MPVTGQEDVRGQAETAIEPIEIPSPREIDAPTAKPSPGRRFAVILLSVGAPSAMLMWLAGLAYGLRALFF
jgi:hypothetical protein